MAMQVFGNVVVDPVNVQCVTHNTQGGLLVLATPGDTGLIDIDGATHEAFVKYFSAIPASEHDPDLRAWALTARDLLVNLRERFTQMNGPEVDRWFPNINNLIASLPKSISPQL